MMNPFADLVRVEARPWTALPARYRRKRRTAWSQANRQGASLDSFLEGPAFDRRGRLHLVDIPFGRLFRVDAAGRWELLAEYDGWPNGLAFHRDGRGYIADYRRGLLALDARRGRVEPVLETAYSESFRGLNDLVFAGNGDLYFTDQGQTGIAEPTGRVFRLRAGGELQRLVANAPSPNGIALNAAGSEVLVAMTRSQQVWRLPLMADGAPSKTGVAIQLSGGHGPDGLAMDEAGGLALCHLGVGAWRFDARGLPTHFIHGGEKTRLFTNLAYGGPGRRTLYLVDSLNGEVLTAELPVAGLALFSGR